jgi:hypothetical protein
MLPTSLRVALVTAVALWAATMVSGAPATTRAEPVLTLSYTAGHALAVSTANGTTITAAAAAQVPPGSYQVVITDDAADESDPVHMFQLSGPGVEVMTDLQGGDDKSELYNETLAANATYSFQDDDEPNLAPVVFTTTSTAAAAGSAPANTPTVATSTTGSSGAKSSSNSSVIGSDARPAPLRGTLAATVAGNGAITLRDGNKQVTSLNAGRYRLVVSDRSAKVGFVLQARQQPAHTLSGGRFVGRRTSTLDLSAGQWFFYSTFTGRKRYFIVVA